MKIKNLSFKKTEEVIEREWMGVDAKRTQLLSSSEWTQSVDNDLTMESQSYWTEWSRLVREVNRLFYTVPETALERLEELFNQQPRKDFVATARMRQQKYPVDISSLDTAKADAHKAVKDFVSKSIKDIFPDDSISIMAANMNVQSFHYTAMEDFTHYPLLEQYRITNNFNIYETIDYIHNMFNQLTLEISKYESIKKELKDSISNAETITQIINILKKMHGY